MSKYTPGPWRLTEFQGCFAYVSSVYHGDLARVVWRIEDDEHTPECEANARLISAAPDLLEALKRIKETGVYVGAIAEEMMDSAIKRAEGTE
jgi:hypothetical protein